MPPQQESKGTGTLKRGMKGIWCHLGWVGMWRKETPYFLLHDQAHHMMFICSKESNRAWMAVMFAFVFVCPLHEAKADGGCLGVV